MDNIHSKFCGSIKNDQYTVKILWIHKILVSFPPKFYGSIKKETVCSQNFVDPQKFETSDYGALLFHKIQNVNISSKVTELLRFNPSITDNFNHKTTQSGRKNLIKSHVSVCRKKRAVHRAQRTETP